MIKDKHKLKKELKKEKPFKLKPIKLIEAGVGLMVLGAGLKALK
jgi:hypothetical protein